VLFTHTHSDHFFRETPLFRTFAEERKHTAVLNMYFSPEAYTLAEKLYSGEAPCYSEDFIRLHRLDYYNSYTISDYTVVPLKGRHTTADESVSANYLIYLPEGKTMYYALDSGYFYEETFEYLQDKHLDVLVLECTYPIEHKGEQNHMDLTTVCATLDELYRRHTIDADTTVYLSHICGYGKTHSEIEQYWENKNTPCKIIVAYDGLTID
jgi:phosphoribosyl 1,2-cyclic phosphate phosphodiesterase